MSSYDNKVDFNIKENNCRNYDRKYYSKNVGLVYLKDRPEYLIQMYNNDLNHTGSTIKHPNFCPTGSKCKLCRHNNKGWMKTKIKNNIDNY
jgi:hypothetical protein